MRDPPEALGPYWQVRQMGFIVLDGEIVETGSFNFTSSTALRNAEIVVALRDPAVASQYAAEWERLWAESEEMKPRY